jgi:hypothetical protein
MSFIEFDKEFTVPEEFDLNILDSLPIHKHRYGQPMEENPTTLYWTEYQPYQEGDGTISFARKLYLQYPKVAQHVVDYIHKFFPTLQLDVQRVNLIKTHGSIRQHMDESNRKCSINIGIKNSNGAITKTSNTRNHFVYPSVAEIHQCQDGHGYLLDTSCIHQVIATNDNPRYLFTYGFGETFEAVSAMRVNN